VLSVGRSPLAKAFAQQFVTVSFASAISRVHASLGENQSVCAFELLIFLVIVFVCLTFYKVCFFYSNRSQNIFSMALRRPFIFTFLRQQRSAVVLVCSALCLLLLMVVLIRTEGRSGSSNAATTAARGIKTFHQLKQHSGVRADGQQPFHRTMGAQGTAASSLLSATGGHLDAIVIPGGGSQRASSARSLPVSVRKRLDLALERWY
jgi:hypothetical protein